MAFTGVWLLHNGVADTEERTLYIKFQLAENVEKLSEVHVKHGEAFRETKIRLETDLQTLEQELEQIKAVCLINSEKLDYNYQVLKKREDENIKVKNNQKKTLNKYESFILPIGPFFKNY